MFLYVVTIYQKPFFRQVVVVDNKLYNTHVDSLEAFLILNGKRYYETLITRSKSL